VVHIVDRLLRTTSVLALLAIAVLSLVPGPMRPHLNVGGQVEHLIAYFATALSCALWIADDHRLRASALLIAYAGLLEMAQLWIPGRYAQLIDFAAGAVGVILGFVVGGLAAPLYRRWAQGRSGT
jgi:VanZ family protein